MNDFHKKALKNLEERNNFVSLQRQNKRIMVQAKNYKNREEVIADFRRAFARKREWLEQSEKELMNMPSRRKPTVV